MTEAEWLAGTDPEALVGHLAGPGPVGLRKLRLCTAACCRRVEGLCYDSPQGVAVDTVERFADGLAGRPEVAAACAEAWNEFRRLDDLEHKPLDVDRRAETSAAYAIALACSPVVETRPDLRRVAEGLHHVASAAVTATWAAVMAESEWHTWDGPGTELADGWSEAEAAAQAELLRDVFGNPFRPVTADPRWLTSTAVSLAQAIYAERAFDRLPILADALEDAGCDEPAVLNHLRGEGPHVRGCWAVDLVLGKE